MGAFPELGSCETMSFWSIQERSGLIMTCTSESSQGSDSAAGRPVSTGEIYGKGHNSNA